MKYKQDWHHYKREFGDKATMSYETFCRLMHQEEQQAFFHDMAVQAVALDGRNRLFAESARIEARNKQLINNMGISP